MPAIFTFFFWYEKCDILIQMWMKYMRPSAVDELMFAIPIPIPIPFYQFQFQFQFLFINSFSIPF